MNCLLLDPEECAGGLDRIRIDGRRGRHADEILRLAPGDEIRVGEIGGRLGRGRLLGLEDGVLELCAVLDAPPPAKRPVTLVLALPRPPVFRRLLSTVASLGVDRLIVAGTARTEGSFWQSRELRPAAIRERLLLGLEQARDTILPPVELERSFRTLVDELLPTRIRGRRALVAHPEARHACPHALEEPIVLFVGPEGGLLDREVERLEQIGFEAVHLGRRPIRVEPVIPMLIGRCAP